MLAVIVLLARTLQIPKKKDCIFRALPLEVVLKMSWIPFPEKCSLENNILSVRLKGVRCRKPNFGYFSNLGHGTRTS